MVLNIECFFGFIIAGQFRRLLQNFVCHLLGQHS